MRKIRTVFIVILCILVTLPLVQFNFEKDYASPIDNRMLTKWDIHSEDFTEMVDSYIKDRIGFRTEAIDAYTELNDKVYGMMIHPTYTYGKDGYVFFRMSYEMPEPIFFDLFCAYLRQVQNYCEEREVPFIYCLNPSKTTVYQQYLPRGYEYLDSVNTKMYEKLEEYGVNYITNEDLLIEKSKKEQVYNKKYDAGHWNDLGAFYGSNHILEKVKEYYPNVQLNKISDFEIKEITQTSLPVSHFKINETVPVFLDKKQENIEDVTEDYNALKMNENYNALYCLRNHGEGAEELPKVLVFQGSYYNGRQQYFQSAFQEYDGVHNYENFLNFDYYFNIFQPECVILETTEYATNGMYFSYGKLEQKMLNPKLDIEEHNEELISLEDLEYTITEKGNLITLSVKTDKTTEIGYLIIGDKQFDFAVNQDEKVAECTVDKANFVQNDIKVFFQ